MVGKILRCKRAFAAGLCAAFLLSMSACQENPEGSIVVHKDMDNLISRAQDDAPEKTDAAQIAEEVKEQFETYRTTIEDEELGVTVNVNAKVDVPEVDALNVYRVRQVEFDQEFIDLVREKLMGNQAVYDGSFLFGTTREGYLNTIAMYREDLTRLEAEREQKWEDAKEFMSEEQFNEGYEANIQYHQEIIDEYQEAYETVPDRIDVTEHPHDGIVRTVEELYAADPDNEHYSKLYRNWPEIGYLNIITDGADGNHQVLRVQNSEDYGAHLDFHSAPNGYYSGTDFIYFEGLTDLSADRKGDTLTEVSPADDETLTQEDAIRQAEEFLEEIGVTGFAFAGGGLYNESIGVRIAETNTNFPMERRCYILQFRRKLNDVWLSQPGGGKFYSGRDDQGVYSKKVWIDEGIEFRIDESGIVRFYMAAPLEIAETVVENAALKSFEEVKNTFETMVCIVNARKEQERSIDIDKVRLCYSRISEQDSFDTGLIVPIWSFEGRTEFMNGGLMEYSTEAPLMINAIDGSIIDGALGY